MPVHSSLLSRLSRASAMLGLIGGLCAAPPSTHATPASAVSGARSAVCAPGARELTETRALDAVAQRLRRGESLHAALSSLPARPEFATTMHLAGLSDDHAIATAVAGRFCHDLSDRRLREIGVATSSREVWIVVVAPLEVPSPGSDPEVARDVLARVNRARASGHRCGRTAYPPAGPLSLSPRLSEVAHGHSLEMARAGGIDHRGRDGSTPVDRVRRSGYVASMVGENVAGGVPNAAEVVAGWLESPGHCSNIMERRFTQLGVGFVVDPSSALQIYWTQVFATP